MLLGIDTCGGTGTIALARWSEDAVFVLSQRELAGKTYSAQLMPAIQEMLGEMLAAEESDAAALQAVVVVNGPGSFTGVRIGVSTAKALAEALSIPLVALSRLAVLAQKARTDAAALDAGRGEVYFRTHRDEALLRPEEAGKQFSGQVAVCEESTAGFFPEARLVEPPSAADALLFAVPRLLARDFNDVEAIDGNYVRRSDAELFAKPGFRPKAGKA